MTWESMMKEVTAGNQLKARQLGMPIGTAMNRLRKQLLFSYLQTCGDNKCCRCGKPIENLYELSIDHVIPWLHAENPVECFFDLSNIAFAHLTCNSKAARKTRKIEVPSGHLYCYRCKTLKTLQEFPINAPTVTTYRPACRVCDSAYRQVKKLKNKGE